MPKKRFSDEQVAFALRQAKSGTPVGEICRQNGGGPKRPSTISSSGLLPRLLRFASVFVPSRRRTPRFGKSMRVSRAARS
jgi:hypothetical protein